MRLAAATLALIVGLRAFVAGLLTYDPLPPEPIPLRAAAVATPVRFPTMPPIRATPMFAPLGAGPTPYAWEGLLDWHRRTLTAGYRPDESEPSPMGMH